jgi:PDZ domain-containing protein
MIRCLAAAIALLAIAVPRRRPHYAEIFATDNTATITDANDARLDARVGGFAHRVEDVIRDGGARPRGDDGFDDIHGRKGDDVARTGADLDRFSWAPGDGSDRIDGGGGRDSVFVTGSADANVGVGFAIPSDTVESVAHQLIANGKVEHAYIGVQVETIPQGISKLVRGVPARGVAIAKVSSGSPAAHAGLQAATHTVTADGQTVLLGGDSITALNGKPVLAAQDLADAVARLKPGDRVSLTVVRGGAARTVPVVLGTSPAT